MPDNPFTLVHPSFRQYLDNILGSRDKVVWGKERFYEIEAINKHDPDEHYIHIQHLPAGEEMSDGSVRKEDLYVVWRIDDWKNDYIRLTELRQKSEESRQRNFLRTEQIDKLRAGIVKSFGLDNEQAIALAIKIYQKGEKGGKLLAEQVGLTDIIWRL